MSRKTNTPMLAITGMLAVAALGTFFLPLAGQRIVINGSDLTDIVPLVAAGAAAITAALALLTGKRKPATEGAPAAADDWAADQAPAVNEESPEDTWEAFTAGFAAPGSDDFDVPPVKLSAAERREAKAAAKAAAKRAKLDEKFRKAAEKEAAKAARAAEKAARKGNTPVSSDILEDETGTGWSRGYDDADIAIPAAADEQPAAQDQIPAPLALDTTPVETPYAAEDTWPTAAEAAQARVEALTAIVRDLLAAAELDANTKLDQFKAELADALTAAQTARTELITQIDGLHEDAKNLTSTLQDLRATADTVESELAAVTTRTERAEQQLDEVENTFRDAVRAVAMHADSAHTARLAALHTLADARADLDSVIVDVLNAATTASQAETDAIRDLGDTSHN